MKTPAYQSTFSILELDMVEDPKTNTKVKLKKFESVSRMRASAVSKDKHKCELILDFNCDIYPLKEGDKVVFALADEEAGESLVDNFDYAMHGRLFKYGDGGSDAVLQVFASFGGLMMQLSVSPEELSPSVFNVNDTLYMMMKRV